MSEGLQRAVQTGHCWHHSLRFTHRQRNRFLQLVGAPVTAAAAAYVATACLLFQDAAFETLCFSEWRMQGKEGEGGEKSATLLAGTDTRRPVDLCTTAAGSQQCCTAVLYSWLRTAEDTPALASVQCTADRAYDAVSRTVHG